MTSLKSRLDAVARSFSRAAWLSRPSDAPLPHREEPSLHPYRAEAQPPCKYDGHEISYRCDSW